jgi:hypothetical protein
MLTGGPQAAQMRTLGDIATMLKPASERAQFARIRLPGGIFKTTIAGRLPDVDCATTAALGAQPRKIDAIDVGASSGSTTVDLLRALRSAGHTPAMLLTDIALKARLVQLTPGHAVLLTKDGELLQHVLHGVPVRPWRRRLDHLTQYWVVTELANARFRRLRAAGALAAPRRSEDIWMVVPEIAQEPAISCEEGDVFADPPAAHLRRFDLVRAANLLIPGVFSPERIGVAIAGLVARLRGPGAVLVLARSPAPGQPGENRATLYRVEESGALAIAGRVGAGIDIEALVPPGLAAGTNSSSRP